MRSIAPTQAQVVVLGSQAENGEVVIGNSALPASQQQYSTVANTLVTSDTTTVAIPAGGKAFIQNWDDAAVYVKMGTGAAIGDASVILSAGTAANDGLGGSVMIADFVGTLSFAAAAGSPRVNIAIYS